MKMLLEIDDDLHDAFKLLAKQVMSTKTRMLRNYIVSCVREGRDVLEGPDLNAQKHITAHSSVSHSLDDIPEGLEYVAANVRLHEASKMRLLQERAALQARYKREALEDIAKFKRHERAEKEDAKVVDREITLATRAEFKRQERAEREAEKAARAEAKRLADAADPTKAAKAKVQALALAQRQAGFDQVAADQDYYRRRAKFNNYLLLLNWSLLPNEDVCEGLVYVHGDYITQMLWTEPDGPDADPVIRATVCNMMGGPTDEHTFDMPWGEFCYIIVRAYEWEKDNGCLNPTTGQPYSENKFARSMAYTRAYYTENQELKIPELTLKKITRTLR